ncbi:uncharacterized protein LOC117642467 [Thrips palmi]|uniref:Uncharacterized protein LOC117642467 n=1 Tax=Thrips palmi TaxID=161013 RepID=A0A6P8YR93_THRPL|nr:uncharacterized protein LOC117642467 [Thrips palmi]
MASETGPYICHFDRFGDCPGMLPGKHDTRHIRLSHYNPRQPFLKQNMTGNITLVEDLYDADACWTSVSLDLRSNNQWKNNYFVFNGSRVNCSGYRRHAPDYFRVMFKQDPNRKGPCFVKAMAQAVRGTEEQKIFLVSYMERNPAFCQREFRGAQGLLELRQK